MQLKVVVNNKEEFEIHEKEQEVSIGKKAHDYTLKNIGNDHYLLHYKNCMYDIKVIEDNPPFLKVNINGQELELTMKDHISQILEELGMDMVAEDTVDEITAPMPGAILEVAVKDGDDVKKGDKLIILEAMKMENVIKSPVDGTISAVHVKPGDNVEKNFALLSF